MSVDAFEKLAKQAGFDVYDVAPKKGKPSGFLHHARSGRTFAFRRAKRKHKAMLPVANEILAIITENAIDLHLAGRPRLTAKLPTQNVRDESERFREWVFGLESSTIEPPSPPSPGGLSPLMKLAGSIKTSVTDAGARHDEYIAESIYEKKMRKS